MDERLKDKVKDAGAAAIEAAVSMVPIVGGPSAVFLNRTFGSAIQRRNERLLLEVAADVERMIEQLALADPEKVLASEDFEAAVHRTLRASQETSSDEKRKLLRNALLNGFVAGDAQSQREQFMAAMVRYQAEHVAVLRAIQSLMEGRSTMLEGAATQVHDGLSEAITFSTVLVCLRELVADGMASESVENQVKEINSRTRLGQPQSRQVVNQKVWHSVSASGEAFIEFVTDPFAEAPAATAP